MSFFKKVLAKYEFTQKEYAFNKEPKALKSLTGTERDQLIDFVYNKIKKIKKCNFIDLFHEIMRESEYSAKDLGDALRLLDKQRMVKWRGDTVEVA